jgi:ribosome maturation factor RimP
MIKKEDIVATCKIALTETQFIVEVKVSSANDVLVQVDDFSGLSIEECKRISRFIESQFDREIEDYALEVGSPGLSNPFKVKEQFVKNIGNAIELIMTDGEKFQAKLLSVEENLIQVAVSEIKKIDNKKQVVETVETIELKNIKTAKNVILFK